MPQVTARRNPRHDNNVKRMQTVPTTAAVDRVGLLLTQEERTGVDDQEWSLIHAVWSEGVSIYQQWPVTIMTADISCPTTGYVPCS